MPRRLRVPFAKYCVSFVGFQGSTWAQHLHCLLARQCSNTSMLPQWHGDYFRCVVWFSALLQAIQ